MRIKRSTLMNRETVFNVRKSRKVEENEKTPLTGSFLFSIQLSVLLSSNCHYHFPKRIHLSESLRAQCHTFNLRSAPGDAHLSGCKVEPTVETSRETFQSFLKSLCVEFIRRAQKVCPQRRPQRSSRDGQPLQLGDILQPLGEWRRVETNGVG